MLTHHRAVLFLTAALLAAAVGTEAQDRIAPQALRQIQALLAEKASRTPVQRRIDSQLLAAYRVRRGLPVARGITTLPGLTEWMAQKLQPGDVVRVDIRATVTAALLEDLRRQGATVESAYPEYGAVRAGIPLARVERIAALDGVRFVEPAHEAVTNVGAVTSQGDAAHRAPQARALGLTGAGVKVGVLSDGVASLATSQATGDLPTGANMTVLPGQAGSGNEGTAMLEIVHDLAPGAPLSFATAFGGVASFAANIRALRDAGCQVIVDDVTYFNEGAFQDGPIAQAVNDVTATGVLYFSSAANSGNLTRGTSGTWEGDWVNSGVTIPAIGGASPVHRFAAGEISNLLITVNAGRVSLKWSDPLGASTNDYDLFVLDGTLTNVMDSSTSSQTGIQDPYELTAGSQPAGRRIVVVNWLGAAATRALRIDTNRGRLAIATAGSTYGHNGGEKTISVASTHAGVGSPFVGGTANPIQTYSSDGPRRIFYEPNGTAVTPGNVLFGTGGGRLLQKPDVTAADCVSTTVSGFATFCGTSAAAPHAGAIAALLLSASPAPTPALVRTTLGATALDTMAAGVDRDSGYGIAMADRAAAASDVAVAMTGPVSVAPGANASYAITVTNNGVGGATSVQLAAPTPAGLVFVTSAGDCTTPFPCALGTLPAGATRTVVATFNVPALYSGANPFTSTASVTAGSIDPVSGNNSASMATAIALGAASADLSVSKSGPAFAARGSSVAYTVVVTNAGPSAAGATRLLDPTPAGLSFVSNAGDCTTPFPCALGTLAAGASRTVTSTFSVPVDYPAPQPVVNAASVSAGTGDPSFGNNASTATSRFGTFYTLTPCRLADTRDPASPGGPPALQPGAERTFFLAGGCGLPEGATAVAVNVTITGPTHVGNLRIFPADVALPLVSTINFQPGDTRANNAVVAAPADGSVALTVRNESVGPVHFILDVTGYFQ